MYRAIRKIRHLCKMFDGVDALYLIRYDIIDINTTTDKEMTLMGQMISSSRLVKNPQY
jgi:hypothetical protein